MSERRACLVIGCCRMTVRYEVIRQCDPALRERLKELAKVRRRFGYRRLHVFLRREGHEVNHKRLFRILTVVDDCTRECLALIADTSLSGARVARELATLFEARGKPQTIVSDNGTEFTSNAILKFVDDRKFDWHYRSCPAAWCSWP